MKGVQRTLFREQVAIALVSAAVILLQVAVTRIFSVVLWYHFAFLSVSIAMLGIGAPGVWFSLMDRPERLLKPLLLAAGALIPLSLIAVLSFPFVKQYWKVVPFMVFLLPPLLSLGGAVCLLLMAAPGKAVSRMYGSDLLGACAGALAIVTLLDVLPTPYLYAAVGFLPLLALLVLEGRPTLPLTAIALVLIGLLVWGEPFQVKRTKRYDESSMKLLYERWTPTARLTVFDSIFWQDKDEQSAGFAWGLGSKATRPQIEQYWLDQDGSAGTPVTRFDGDLSKVAYLNGDVTTVGYQLRPPERAVIIGAGGGRDILAAKVAGAKTIDAVELNPHIIDLVSNQFGAFSGDVYHAPGVTPHASEGRSFMTHSEQRYDMVQISLIDSFAATAAGAFALSENNLYTVQAYRLYWSRLSAQGLISTSRWTLGPHGLELPRLVLLVKAALEAEGIESPLKHLVVVQGSRVGTVLASRTPFAEQELERLDAIAEQRGFLVHYPVTSTTPPDSKVDRTLRSGWKEFAEQGFNLAPPTDDAPFYFQMLRPFRRYDFGFATSHGTNNTAILSLQLLAGSMLLITLALFFLPFYLRRWMPIAEDFWRGSGFFAAIGIAFMLIEIPWLQRFILYLGHPSYATTVVLACMLLGAGIGSIVSGRLSLRAAQRSLLLAPVVLLGVNLTFSSMFSATLGLSWGVRALLSAAALVPSGFLMGFFFPTGMLRFGDLNKAWFWAVNGAAGVLSSVVSLMLAIEFGLLKVSMIGVVCYVIACGLVQGAGPLGGAEKSAGSAS